MNRPSLFFFSPSPSLLLSLPSYAFGTSALLLSLILRCVFLHQFGARRAIHLFSELCCLSVAFILFVTWFDRTFKSCRRGAIGASRRPEDGGDWLLFRIKEDSFSRSNPDRVLFSSLDMLTFNVRMSYYWKPLDETLLNDPSSLLAERFCETETSWLLSMLLYFFYDLLTITVI